MSGGVSIDKEAFNKRYKKLREFWKVFKFVIFRESMILKINLFYNKIFV